MEILGYIILGLGVAFLIAAVVLTTVANKVHKDIFGDHDLL